MLVIITCCPVIKAQTPSRGGGGDMGAGVIQSVPNAAEHLQ